MIEAVVIFVLLVLGSAACVLTLLGFTPAEAPEHCKPNGLHRWTGKACKSHMHRRRERSLWSGARGVPATRTRKHSRATTALRGTIRNPSSHGPAVNAWESPTRLIKPVSSFLMMSYATVSLGWLLHEISCTIA